MNSRKVTVWFLLRIRLSTPKDEKERIMKSERIMKLQEKYRPITQRVLNPNANSFVGSRKICIPSVGPRLQNGVLLLIKFKITKEM